LDHRIVRPRYPMLLAPAGDRGDRGHPERIAADGDRARSLSSPRPSAGPTSRRTRPAASTTSTAPCRSGGPPPKPGSTPTPAILVAGQRAPRQPGRVVHRQPRAPERLQRGRGRHLRAVVPGRLRLHCTDLSGVPGRAVLQGVHPRNVPFYVVAVAIVFVPNARTGSPASPRSRSSTARTPVRRPPSPWPRASPCSPSRGALPMRRPGAARARR
jgi:hypothetical protein